MNESFGDNITTVAKSLGEILAENPLPLFIFALVSLLLSMVLYAIEVMVVILYSKQFNSAFFILFRVRALLNSYVPNQLPSIIKMFDKDVSTEQYSEWIVRNGYSKQVPLEGQIAGNESTEDGRVVYALRANVCQNPNNRQDIAAIVFYAHVELKDETWPLFQHLIRIVMDPFIYIRYLAMYSLKGVLSSFAGAVNPVHNRLQCKQLKIDFTGVTLKFVAWIKDHARCDEFVIYGNKDSNYDEELLDLFLTGAPCTFAIQVVNYDLLDVIVDLVQIFMGLKNREEYQLIESIRGKFKDQGALEEFKRNLAKCIAEEGQYEEGRGIIQVIGFINTDIEKKLTLNVRNTSFRFLSFSIKISNL